MITSLCKLGLLAIYDGVRVGFASPILRHILTRHLFASSTMMDNSLFDTASHEDKLLTVIALMKSETMMQSYNVGVNMALLERQWQMEFYCAASTVFPRAILSPDVGRLFGSDGFLDFYIDSNMKWGIKLLRNGDKLEQNLKLFNGEGIYHSFASKLKRYCPLVGVFI